MDAWASSRNVVVASNRSGSASSKAKLPPQGWYETYQGMAAPLNSRVRIVPFWHHDSMAPIPASVLPPTWRNHGDPDLICVPAKWSSVALFCLVNYLAHCATVKPYPAETLRELGVAIGLALVLPSSGITRAMDSIVRRPNLRKLNAFKKAAKAGALCMVVRNHEWRPIDGDVLTNADILDIQEYGSKKTEKTMASSSEITECNGPDSQTRALLAPEELDEADEFDLGIGYTALETIVRPPRGDPEGSLSDYYVRVIRSPGCMKELNHTSQPNQSIIKRGCKIHGLCDLPEGFSLAYVPADAIVEPIRQPEDNEVDKGFAKMQDVSSSYSFTKAAIAIVQTVYASITLYRAQGDQLRVYGYAAFGLTVIPYILMSILNLLGQIACPDYPTLYIVHSDTMDEAKRHGGVFEGVTGSLRSLKGTETLKDSKLDYKGPWTVSMCRNICTLRPDDAEVDTQLPQIDFRVCLEDSDGGVGRVTIAACRPFACRSDRKWPYPWSSDIKHRGARWSVLLNVVAPLIFGCVSLLIVGLISKFRKGQNSTSLQRGFVMSWLIVGMFLGAVTRGMSWFLRRTESRKAQIYRALAFPILWGVFLVPAVGGIVVVCKMIAEFGTCTRIDG